MITTIGQGVSLHSCSYWKWSTLNIFPPQTSRCLKSLSLSHSIPRISPFPSHYLQYFYSSQDKNSLRSKGKRKSHFHLVRNMNVNHKGLVTFGSEATKCLRKPRKGCSHLCKILWSLLNPANCLCFILKCNTPRLTFQVSKWSHC